MKRYDREDGRKSNDSGSVHVLRDPESRQKLLSPKSVHAVARLKGRALVDRLVLVEERYPVGTVFEFMALLVASNPRRKKEYQIAEAKASLIADARSEARVAREMFADLRRDARERSDTVTAHFVDLVESAIAAGGDQAAIAARAAWIAYQSYTWSKAKLPMDVAFGQQSLTRYAATGGRVSSAGPKTAEIVHGSPEHRRDKRQRALARVEEVMRTEGTNITSARQKVFREFGLKSPRTLIRWAKQGQ